MRQYSAPRSLYKEKALLAFCTVPKLPPNRHQPKKDKCRELVPRPRPCSACQEERFHDDHRGQSSSPSLWSKKFPVASVALTKNYALPVTNVGFREVSKQTRILDTFLIHPWPILIFHEPAPHSVEQLVKLVYRPLSGSKRLISDHLDNMTSDHRVAGSSPAGCNVLRDLCQESRSRSSKVLMTVER